jgi:hypothetical protein
MIGKFPQTPSGAINSPPKIEHLNEQLHHHQIVYHQIVEVAPHVPDLVLLGLRHFLNTRDVTAMPGSGPGL